MNFRIAGANAQQDVSGAYVSGDYFSTLGVSAVLGRALQSSDDRPSAPPDCVLGYGLWRRLYGGSRDAIGRPIQVNGNEFRVVGVAPRSFFGVDVGVRLEVFMPLEAERRFKDYPLLYGRQTPSLDDPATLLGFVARLRTLLGFLAQDLGYDPRGVLTAHASWQGSGESPQREAAVGEELLRTFRSLPGVTSASWGRIFFKTMNPQVAVPGPNGSARRLGSYLIFVSSDSFRTLRTPMLAGRDFTAGDSGTSFPAAILSEELAKVLFGGVNPVRLRFRENDSRSNGQDHNVEVVGVAKAGSTAFVTTDSSPILVARRT